MPKRIEDFPQVAGAIGEARAALGLAANRKNEYWLRLDEVRKRHYMEKAGVQFDGRLWSEYSVSEKYRIEKEINRILRLARADAEAMGVLW